MNCPACSRGLSEIKLETVSVLACRGGCGGLWFDGHEIQKVEYGDEPEGRKLLDVERDSAVNVNLEAKRRCPRCDLIMMQHFYSPKRKVVIDECPKCTGVWLDAGELGAIRGEYHSEAERKRAAEEYLNDVFGKQLSTHAEKYQRVAKAFSLLHSPMDFVLKRK